MDDLFTRVSRAIAAARTDATRPPEIRRLLPTAQLEFDRLTMMHFRAQQEVANGRAHIEPRFDQVRALLAGCPDLLALFDEARASHVEFMSKKWP